MFDQVFLQLTLKGSVAVPVWQSEAESLRHLLKTLPQSPAFSALFTQHRATELHEITPRQRVTSR